ncbi:IS66 family insertion sequence element accessory protein TnpB [Cobetia marina]|nr:IS66 family insertion sequence element accessory protein TnpB [Cobetia marina]
MRTGLDAALARAVKVFGASLPHSAYLFANRHGNRMKVLIHDGLGVWLCARHLNLGKFYWAGNRHGDCVELCPEQVIALVLGLPRQRLGADGVISVVRHARPSTA